MLNFVKRKESRPLTEDIKLDMRPIRAALAEMGVDWDSIPESEYRFVVGLWRRDRMAKGDIRADWQLDGENFVLLYAKNHRWNDPEVVERMVESRREHQRRPAGSLTDAQRDAMTQEEYLEWEARQID